MMVMDPDPAGQHSGRSTDSHDLLRKALAARASGDLQGARDFFRTVVDINPASLPAWEGLRQVDAKLGWTREILDIGLRAVTRESRPPLAAYLHLFAAADQLGELSSHQDALATALGAFPDCALLRHYHGVLLEDTDRPTEALLQFGRAASLRPDVAEFHLSLAQSYLSHGLFKPGWREFEWRHRLSRVPRRAPRAPAWDGQAGPGKRLLVYAEQGRGDVIQFSRFLRALPPDMSVTLEVYDDLVELFAGLPGVRVVGPSAPSPPIDVECSLLSLPHLLDLSRSGGAIVDGAAYLDVSTPSRRSWAARLAAAPGLKVGVVWQGNPQFGLDQRRSIPAAALTSLAAVDGLHIINLQKNAHPDDLASWRAVSPLHDGMDEVRTFSDTAALVANLDLVVGVDTAVIHLSGALGVPTWLLNRTPAHWTWQAKGDHSIWYDSVRQFRQTTPGDWTDVIGRVAHALTALTSKRHPAAASLATPASRSRSGHEAG